MAAELVERGEALAVSRVRGEHDVALIALRLLGLRGDDLEGPLACEIIESGGEGGDAEVRVAGRDRKGNGLRGLEELRLDVEPLVLEVAFVDGDEEAARGHKAQ